MSLPLAEFYLTQAWRRLSPKAPITSGFPTGFWPDVARVAVLMAMAEDTEVELPFEPHGCLLDTVTNPPSQQKSKAKTKAENTAALLAKLSGKLP